MYSVQFNVEVSGDYKSTMVLRNKIILLFCAPIQTGGGGGELGCTISLFICLSCWSNRIAALFLCYHSTALCTSKGNISACAICYL